MMKRPFIKLFRTPNSWYFYDVAKSELCQIQPDSYLFLQRLLDGDVVSEPPDELVHLAEMGYLTSESPVEELCHPYSRYLPQFLDRNLRQLILQVTQSCNFRCKYCIYSETSSARQRHHSAKHMTWDMAKRAVDFLWEHSIDSRMVSISFYGGEPLLQFPLVQRVIQYSKARFVGKKLTFNMTTNGTLLTDDIIRYLAEHEVSLMISIDGPREINDANRVFANGQGNFDTVMGRIRRIHELEPEYAQHVHFSMVIDPTNDFDCINSVCVDYDVVHRGGLNAAIVDKEYDDEETRFSSTYIEKYQYQMFLSYLSYWGKYPKERISPITYQALANAMDKVSRAEEPDGLQRIDVPSGPCVPGKMRVFVNVEGRFFPCERVSETSPAMCIGSLETGFDLENAERLLNFANITSERCKRCWCFRHCTLCAKKADTGEAQLSPTQKLKYCQEAKGIAYREIQNCLLMREIYQFYPGQVRRGKDREVSGL